MTFEKTCESFATGCIFSDAAVKVCCEVEKPGVRNEHAFSQFFSIRCEDTSVCHTLENKTSLKWAFCNT
jgi:hypothetical protein